MWESLVRGFGWTLGRHAATDVYRRPGLILAILGAFVALVWQIIRWGLALLFFAVVGACVVAVWYGVST